MNETARRVGLDRKMFRRYLKKFRIGTCQRAQTTTEPVQTIVPDSPHDKLLRRFYNGVNFKRGMIAYLHFNGECTTHGGVRELAKTLGGLYFWNEHKQYKNWNALQTLLTKLGILVSTPYFTVYDWNDACVPIEYKHALVRKTAGEDIEQILTFYFPEQHNN